VKITVLIVAVLCWLTAVGQHEHHGAPTRARDSMPKNGDTMMMMSHAYSRNLPMSRNGSGTSWLPDNSPVYAYMFHGRKWMYMVHGAVFARYNKQDLFDDGSRGGSQFDVPSMVMFMGQRNVGAKGLFHFSTMASLDPVAVGGSGYPLLFQTGETYKGEPLVDRQHPHDLISELSVSYAHSFSRDIDLYLYLGYPGEPALGPSAYIHRPSAFFNPDAPLSHHWVDATHITFGVATAGLRTGKVKWEFSSFTGREPDEDRYDFDEPRFDSWSGRLSYNPASAWSMQVSHAFIREPEELHPDEDVNRTTASLTFSGRGNGSTNITALWGMNKTAGHDPEHAALIEGSYILGRMAYYGRLEWVQKSVEELDLDESRYGHDAIFPVTALTAGLAYDIGAWGQTRLSLGGQLSVFGVDETLRELYGEVPVSGQVYLRLYPGMLNYGRSR